MLLPVLLSALTAVSAAVCPRGFLVHPASDPSYCLSVPGAENVKADSEYTLGILVISNGVGCARMRAGRTRSCSKTSPLQTLRYPTTTRGPRPTTVSASRADTVGSNACCTDAPVIGNDPYPPRGTAGSPLKFDVCYLAQVDQGQSWYLRGNQIKGNPMIDPSTGEQKVAGIDHGAKTLRIQPGLYKMITEDQDKLVSADLKPYTLCSN
ncbi:hypothetical protein A1Q1_02571 [Trichosporon asahii var. asahii CBS 2479]|uniref:Uncharacterized protein n=1 Tax=Trichosporon asahii var. asahii (strain ATCC 90039 / CBS 2479 / JCM 2466 / KCTC 7840 / NBRC 103889/ NCYC 2677 / UAMH 7654) TaxID=1186058 RepID=J6EV16_TRIAS|nr:hypothetical protein A1Q1_02571 [Trichosporon asahii var. asahii CBS 2479]EJT48439.1 hypothetical protein A1Q1_02571 [Trichosporon asahii var. asahii CBS 2479]